jgi:hypothetical protein
MFVKEFDILFGLVLRKPVSFLNLALKLVSPPIYDVEIVIGKTSPLLLGSTLELLPVSFNSIPVHDALLFPQLTERFPKRFQHERCHLVSSVYDAVSCLTLQHAQRRIRFHR